MTDNYKFDVALSFAGAQRDYVDQVARILGSKGINVFYDQLYKSHFWGRDLATYLQEVYYKQARYCMMFISKEYVTEPWPSWERQNALARQLKTRKGYIIPVRFDDAETPGLSPSIGYINGKKESPEEIARLFLEKIKNEIDFD